MRLIIHMKSLIISTKPPIVLIAVFSVRHTKKIGLPIAQMQRRVRKQGLVTVELMHINTSSTNAGKEVAMLAGGKRCRHF
jgi:hypothetical protein